MNQKKIKKHIKKLLLTMTIGMGIAGGYKTTFDILVEQKQQMIKETKDLESDAFERLIPDQELELSKAAESAINEISRQVNHNSYLDALNVNDNTLLASYSSIDDTTSHTYTALYDSSTDSINWDKAVDYIYVNSLLKADNKDGTYAPTKREIIEYLSLFQEVYNQLKADFLEYDTKKLACKLEYFDILKSSMQDDSIIAQTSNSEIVLNPLYNMLSDKEKEDIIKHEEFHVSVCDCIDNKNGIIFGTSIPSTIALGVKDDTFVTERYHWKFVEEGYTSLYTKEMTSGLQETYITYDEALDWLQAVLALNEDYQVDDILKQIVYQEPVEFVQNFPVYGEDRKKFFMDNLKALKGLDILVGTNKQWIDYLNTNYSYLDYTLDAQIEMKTAINNQFSKLYFNGLIVLNEKHPEMTLEDNAAFINLFIKWMNNITLDNTLIEENENLRSYLEDKNIEVRPYSLIQINYQQDLKPNFPKSTFVDYRNIFIEYLGNKYHKDPKNLDVELLSPDIVREDYLFPEFLGEEKQKFYQFLYEDKREVYDSYPRVLVKQK